MFASRCQHETNQASETGPSQSSRKALFLLGVLDALTRQGTLSLSIVYCCHTVESKVKQHSLLVCLELSGEKRNVNFPQAHMLSVLVWLWN